MATNYQIELLVIVLWLNYFDVSIETSQVKRTQCLTQFKSICSDCNVPKSKGTVKILS